MGGRKVIRRLILQNIRNAGAGLKRSCYLPKKYLKFNIVILKKSVIIYMRSKNRSTLKIKYRNNIPPEDLAASAIPTLSREHRDKRTAHINPPNRNVRKGFI